jgi:hypothetical protein
VIPKETLDKARALALDGSHGFHLDPYAASLSLGILLSAVEAQQGRAARVSALAASRGGLSGEAMAGMRQDAEEAKTGTPPGIARLNSWVEDVKCLAGHVFALLGHIESLELLLQDAADDVGLRSYARGVDAGLEMAAAKAEEDGGSPIRSTIAESIRALGTEGRASC